MTTKPENSENSASLAEVGDKFVTCSLMSAQGYAAKKTSVSESHQSNPPNLGVAAICSGNRMWWSAYL